MLRRMFWLTLGIVLGALAFRRVSRFARSYTPQGLAGRAQDGAVSTLEGLRAFGADVAALAARREDELRRELAENRPPEADAPRGGQSGRRRGDGREFRGTARSAAQERES
ncbi:MAG: hypothetical protein ACK5MT_22520 [Actinomycetales bacterium]